MAPATTSFSERVAASLYDEALALARETHGYFDAAGAAERQALEPRTRVRFAEEALKATIRLTQVFAWVTTRRVMVSAGEPERDEPVRRFGASDPTPDSILDAMPAAPRQLILRGMDLHQRVDRLATRAGVPTGENTSRGLFQRQERGL